MAIGNMWSDLAVYVDGKLLGEFKAADVTLEIDSDESREVFTSSINRERVIVITTDNELRISATLPSRRRVERESL